MKYLESIQKKQNEAVKRLTVGPVPVHPGMLEIMGKQYFSTRDPFFVEILPSLQSFLQESVGTRKSIVILEHGSGSSGLSAVGNHVLAPYDKVLCLNTGKFGERWVKIARKRQCKVIEDVTDWKKTIDWSKVGEILAKEKPIALLMQHSETSTGAVHSLKQARNVIDNNSPNTLLIVDAISSWGSIPIEMDANKIDVVIGSSQKGFMLPTGLHLMAFSEKALSKIEENNKNGFVTDFSHDPISDISLQLKGKPRFSMDSNSILALVYLKEEIIEKEGGWQAWFDKISNRAEKLRKSLKEMNLEIFSESYGDVVTAVLTPLNMTTAEIRKRLLNAGFEVNKSQDEKKFNGFRIGNMGYITDQDMENLISALQKIFVVENMVAI